MSMIPLKPWRLPALLGATLCTALGAALSCTANAGVVLTPVASWASTSNGPHVAGNTHDQSGLSQGYTAGVTDFDAYVASAPTHAAVGVNGWLSQTGDNTPWITYDMGQTVRLDGMALWSGDAYPAAFMTVLVSVDGMAFNMVAVDVPVDTLGLGVDSLPQRIDWILGDARYVTLSAACPPNSSACSIGEVAFSGQSAVVPAPGTAALALAALLALPAWRRRHDRSGR